MRAPASGDEQLYCSEVPLEDAAVGYQPAVQYSLWAACGGAVLPFSSLIYAWLLPSAPYSVIGVVLAVNSLSKAFGGQSLSLLVDGECLTHRAAAFAGAASFLVGNVCLPLARRSLGLVVALVFASTWGWGAIMVLLDTVTTSAFVVAVFGRTRAWSTLTRGSFAPLS